MNWKNRPSNLCVSFVSGNKCLKRVQWNKFSRFYDFQHLLDASKEIGHHIVCQFEFSLDQYHKNKGSDLSYISAQDKD